MNARALQSTLYLARLEKLRRSIKENGFDGIILAPGPNLRYYTGINSLLLERPFLLFIPGDKEAHLVSPELESGPFLRSPLGITVHPWDDGEGPSQAFQEVVDRLSVSGRWALEGIVPFRFVYQLLKYAHPELDDAEIALRGIREIKEHEEVRLLERAASILSKSFVKIPQMIKPGMTELDLARMITSEIYSNDAELVGDVLVQSGGMAADPHHLPSSKKLKRKESIVVDATCAFSGYFADITRTFIIARDTEFERFYENVLEAQRAAIGGSKVGVAVGSVDQAARDSLKRKGLDAYFIHRTGHGLGLEVHEAPYIVLGGNEIIRASMVFTVEPGVYIRDRTGVRIEDDVLVTEQGNKVLTKSVPTEFGWWR